ncbi:MAG: rod shape-determining protein MreC [Clostridia bacterium]|nr:rod shape-determining protein MreC [Clostridia bacterium]
MKRFSKNFYIRVAVASAVILLVMAISTLSVGKADILTNAVNMVTEPMQKCFSFVYDKVSGVVDSFVKAGSYAEENELLKARIAILENDYSDIEAYKAENERLLNLLNMKSSMPQLNLQGASVISIEADNWYNVISIDKGSGMGVKLNDVVLTAQGLVGTVYEVGTTWAKVREIVDMESSISVVCARTGDRGVLEGDFNLAAKGRCKLNYLPKNAKVVIGDRIEISDTGSIYPKGVYVGKIVEIYDDDDGLTLTAIVESEVNFNSLSEVLVGS